MRGHFCPNSFAAQKIGKTKMTTKDNCIPSQRKTAILAGISLVLMAIAAAFSFGYVHSTIFIEGNAIASAANAKNSVGLLYAGIAAWFLIFVLDVVAAIALYYFYKPVHQKTSATTALYRVIYSGFLLVAIFKLISIAQLATNTQLSEQEIANTIQQQYSAFNYIWNIGLIVFGLHLSGLGYLSLKSAYVPKFIGILLVIAAMGYVFVSTQKAFFAEYETETINLILGVPMAAGEIILAFWLWIKGGKQKTN